MRTGRDTRPYTTTQLTWRGTKNDCLRRNWRLCGRREEAGLSSTLMHSTGTRRKEVGEGKGFG